MKTCGVCRLEKPEDAFGMRRGKRRCECKACRNRARSDRRRAIFALKLAGEWPYPVPVERLEAKVYEYFRRAGREPESRYLRGLFAELDATEGR